MINVMPDGTIKFVYNDDLRGLMTEGKATTKRVSHVEPDDDGKWVADMSPIRPNVMLGPFETRWEALDAERKWLEEHL
jgi:hypothetical protein